MLKMRIASARCSCQEKRLRVGPFSFARMLSSVINRLDSELPRSLQAPLFFQPFFQGRSVQNSLFRMKPIQALIAFLVEAVIETTSYKVSKLGNDSREIQPPGEARYRWHLQIAKMKSHGSDGQAQEKLSSTHRRTLPRYDMAPSI